MLKYLPEESLPIVSNWFEKYLFHLKISRSRTSKLGDFRPSSRGKPHRISVNGDLNHYHFLITLTHEVAHVATWINYANSVAPHGIEWQSTYSMLLKEVMKVVSLPSDLKTALELHLNRPKASSCSDPQLYKVLKKYDDKEPLPYLEDINEGVVFTIHGKRVFKKGKKRRSRYECVELRTKRNYLVSGHVEVIVINYSSSKE